MRSYQLVLVLRPSLKDADRKKFSESIKDWAGDAKIKKEDEWGQKPLAYPIKKEVAGYFVNFLLESNENPIPPDFEKKLLTNDNVLRHLLLKN